MNGKFFACIVGNVGIKKARILVVGGKRKSLEQGSMF